MTLDPRTPVIVGVGQAAERIDDAYYRAMSSVELAAAEKVLRQLDAPAPAYEKALLTARCLTDLGVSGEAGRQARVALTIAQEHGWLPRARRVAAEFALDNAAAMPQPSAIIQPTWMPSRTGSCRCSPSGP